MFAIVSVLALLFVGMCYILLRCECDMHYRAKEAWKTYAIACETYSECWDELVEARLKGWATEKVRRELDATIEAAEAAAIVLFNLGEYQDDGADGCFEDTCYFSTRGAGSYADDWPKS